MSLRLPNSEVRPGYPHVKFRSNDILTENVFLTGNQDELKNWSADEALGLYPVNYPTWSGKSSVIVALLPLSQSQPLVTVSLPANTNFEYKYIRKINGVVQWESDPNNLNTTPSSGSYTIHDTWR